MRPAYFKKLCKWSLDYMNHARLISDSDLSEADFAGGDSPTGDYALVIAIFGVAYNVLQVAEELSQYPKHQPLPDYADLVRNRIRDVEANILRIPLDGEGDLVLDGESRNHAWSLYSDVPLAKRIHVLVNQQYVKHLRATKTLTFDYETFCSDWRETLGWTPPANGVGNHNRPVYHAVKEFWRRHPKTGSKTVKVKAHMRGSVEKSEARLASIQGPS